MDYDYKPNSHKSKEESTEVAEERKVGKVVSAPVKTKKKGEVRKFADIFIAEDASNVKSYIFMDVLVPAIKKAISDIVTDGINMILYGGTAPSKKSSSGTYVAYNGFSKRDDRHAEPRSRSRLDYDDLIFNSRADAEEVLSRMDELVDRYGFVTVFDLFDMADITPPYTSNKYGWTTIRSAEVVRVRDGWVIKLPKAMPID